MRTHAILWWAAAVSGAAVLLTSCGGTDVDVAAITEAYRKQIATMPQPVVPRLARGTRNGSASSQETALEPRVPGAIFKLSLQEAIFRAMKNSLDIKVESFSPSISAEDVVTAEAKFDAVFFMDAQYAGLDTPINLLNVGGGQSDTRSIDGGFKKHLVTGSDVEVKYQTQWQWANEAGLIRNPHYQTDAIFQYRQSLLQNFGTDVNKAEMRINKNKADISLYEFQRRVIETLSAVEQAYWTLYLTRQALAIGQELLARTERTYALVVQRLQWDALPVNVSQAKSAAASRRAAVFRQQADVKDAEDRLKNLLNDPELPLTSDIAILPTDDPMTESLNFSLQQELWAGLDHRPELQEARLNIGSANINRTVTQNQLLPKLDMVVQWDLTGLAKEKWEPTNTQILDGDFNNITVGFNYEYALGNRSAKAGVIKSKLQQDQAVTEYRREVDQVTTDIQIALRDVQTSFREMGANRMSVDAATEELAALIARQENLSPDYLDLELRTQETQASARQDLVRAIANYNVAIVKLEQAKGTVLQYDRIELSPSK